MTKTLTQRWPLPGRALAAPAAVADAASDQRGENPGRQADGAPRVAVDGLCKTYGAVEAVSDVSLVVEPGRFLVLLGPSGSGKSTVLRCIAGIEVPSGGSIRLGGTMVDGPGIHLPPERRDLAMVFQDYALWPHLSAEQNVAFALKRRSLERAERRRLAREALERVGLGDKAARFPGELSGGEQQRVALARALVARTGLVLFDEPLSNLDADLREQLRIDIGALVRDQRATAIYITHDQAEAFALADVVGVLERGRLVQFGTPEEIYRAPASAFVARFTGLAGELAGTLADVRGEQAVVQTAAGALTGRLLASGRPGRGASAEVLVRPSAVRLAGEGEPGLDGEVLDGAFRGWGYEHVVALAGGRLRNVAAPARVPVGRRVRVQVDPAGCLVALRPAERR
ncbi:ABC transporter ATP-binding protein [Aciditerrimonas ferrireducens]|uniref:ABC transporter ATP-binding protein n=1 Tax=Aciditerrimonas ferrireducens TaxID=667306 RepID=UPI002002CFD1|nr:ABC transporter ATP-binding protein [Aciditerrimonas ferrireducens]MCK4178172.1 ABC transporter ATP-binding protein [Aciditerrimonas ferrireducens]